MSVRAERVARLLQREIADILMRDLGPSLMVTVTDARVSRDLSIAYLSVSVMGGTPEQRQATFSRLVDRTTVVRNQLARRIRHQMRAVPELRFFLDESQENVRRMDTIFERIRQERATRKDESDGQRPNE